MAKNDKSAKIDKVANIDKTPKATQAIPAVNAKNAAQIERESDAQRPLSKKNFIGMAISGVLIVLGFILMLGDSSTTDTFNPDIFSTRRVVVGPLIAFLGFVLMAVSIIIRPADKTAPKTEIEENQD